MFKDFWLPLVAITAFCAIAIWGTLFLMAGYMSSYQTTISLREKPSVIIPRGCSVKTNDGYVHVGCDTAGDYVYPANEVKSVTYQKKGG